VVSDVKKRPEGVRIKHRLGQNSIKMPAPANRSAYDTSNQALSEVQG
jgi:hypothetical protein